MLFLYKLIHNFVDSLGLLYKINFQIARTGANQYFLFYKHMSKQMIRAIKNMILNVIRATFFHLSLQKFRNVLNRTSIHLIILTD